MAGNHNYRRDVRGRFTRVPVDAAYADQSRFSTVAREGIDVGFQGSDPGDLAYDAVPATRPLATSPGAASGCAPGGPSWCIPPTKTTRYTASREQCSGPPPVIPGQWTRARTWSA